MIGKRIGTLFMAGCCWMVSGCATPAPEPLSEPVATAREADGRTATGGKPFHGLIQYRAKDAKVAITNPEFVAAGDALIAAGTKVIGVFLGGEARAYPLFILSNHQIVNDQVGGVPVSASW